MCGMSTRAERPASGMASGEELDEPHAASASATAGASGAMNDESVLRRGMPLGLCNWRVRLPRIVMTAARCERRTRDLDRSERIAHERRRAALARDDHRDRKSVV